MNYIFIIVWLLFLSIAIYCEHSDYARMKKRKNLKELNSKDKIKELKFLACFGYENTIAWRSIYMFSSAITITIYLLLPKMLPSITNDSKNMIAFVLFILCFLTMYFGHTFRSFHLDRELCGKVKNDFIVF